MYFFLLSYCIFSLFIGHHPFAPLNVRGLLLTRVVIPYHSSTHFSPSFISSSQNVFTVVVIAIDTFADGSHSPNHRHHHQQHLTFVSARYPSPCGFQHAMYMSCPSPRLGCLLLVVVSSSLSHHDVSMTRDNGSLSTQSHTVRY